MSRRALAFALALALTGLGGTRSVGAEELSLGVFLPQASFTTNAERSAWAQGLADALGAATGGEHTFVPRTFARRADVVSFMRAKRIDLLVSDGLLIASDPAEVIAHATATPAVGLYGAEGATLTGLRGKIVAFAEAGADDVPFYANTALSGEVAPRAYFGEVRSAKDAGAALGAVRAGAAQAAFAPVGHPASAGLALLAQGGTIPLAVVAVVNPGHIDAALRARIVSGLSGGTGAGGGLGGWAPGDGDALAKARALAKALPRVLTAAPILTALTSDRVAPPPLRLRASGTLEPPRGAPAVALTPTLEDL